MLALGASTVGRPSARPSALAPVSGAGRLLLRTRRGLACACSPDRSAQRCGSGRASCAASRSGPPAGYPQYHARSRNRTEQPRRSVRRGSRDMCVCVCACVRACVWACLCVRACACVSACLPACLPTCVRTWASRVPRGHSAVREYSLVGEGCRTAPQQRPSRYHQAHERWRTDGCWRRHRTIDDGAIAIRRQAAYRKRSRTIARLHHGLNQRLVRFICVFACALHAPAAPSLHGAAPSPRLIHCNDHHQAHPTG